MDRAERHVWAFVTVSENTESPQAIKMTMSEACATEGVVIERVF